MGCTNIDISILVSLYMCSTKFLDPSMFVHAFNLPYCLRHTLIFPRYNTLTRHPDFAQSVAPENNVKLSVKKTINEKGPMSSASPMQLHVDSVQGIIPVFKRTPNSFQYQNPKIACKQIPATPQVDVV